MVFFDYKNGAKIPIGNYTKEYPGCYFDRESGIVSCIYNNFQNPEWGIQQKIIDNEEGFFDFSKNMIDVGAYIGIYRWNLPFRKAWLFEPNKKSYMLCCANAVLHDRVEDTFIYNELLSDGYYKVSFNGYDGMQHDEFKEYLANYNAAYMNYYKTPEYMNTSTLDDHIHEFESIGFIKTDCEGMDWKVLAGGVNTIQKFNYPPILFENWPDYDEHSSYGPGYLNRETPEEMEFRNKMINETLSGMGYEILWEWVPGHPDTHLAVHRGAW